MKPVRRIQRCSWCLPSLLLWGCLVAPCAAREHAEDFESDRPTWLSSFGKSEARLLGQTRSTDEPHGGERAERIEVETYSAVSRLQFAHKIPPAAVIDDLSVSVWYRAERDGAYLSVRVVLPHQINPRTQQPLTLLLEGAPYTRPGQWQRLASRDLKLKLRKQLPAIHRLLQTESGLRGEINSLGAYVDAAVLTIQTGRGRLAVSIDDLAVSSLVDAQPAKEIQQAQATEPDPQPEVEFRISSLFVRDRPHFPLIAPYHEESPEELSRMRLNTIWVPDYADTKLLDELSQSGLGAMAVPPRVTDEEGHLLDPERAHLTPFVAETAPIRYWYLGTRIPPAAMPELTKWVEQISNADRKLKRPLMGDVAGLERDYSRQIQMLGVSRPALQTTFSPKAYRDWLLERRRLAQPGTFTTTWINTEPSPDLNDRRIAAGLSPLVIEPEQLRAQVYAALNAGVRGIGYWTHTPLNSDGPGMKERELELAILNMEIELLEPWLATGIVTEQVPFRAKLPAARKTNDLATPSDNRSAGRTEERLTDREVTLRNHEQLSRNLEAGVLQTDYSGRLALLVWYGDGAQFVPGQLAANDATIVIPGGGDAARAIEISTTKITDIVNKERKTGGMRITLEKFDQTAAILMTNDATIVERLTRKMESMREPSARVHVALARLKLERTAEVDAQLQQFELARQSDAGRILDKARGLLASAEKALAAQNYHLARTESNDCMQLLRILQHNHWSNAVRRMYSPVSSPHTLCFQTLPDHWNMIARYGRARETAGSNLLRSGDFEDFDTIVAAGWSYEKSAIPGIQSTAELNPRARKGGGTYCLRMIATPSAGIDPPTTVSERPVTVTTPPVTVYKGQLVYIRGWVKVAAPSLGSLDGAMLYDSLGGVPLALRWKNPTGWHEFDLVREVPETTDLKLTMTLTGLGEVLFDDLQIIPLDLTPPGGGKSDSPANSKPAKPGALDFFKRLPGFRGKPDGDASIERENPR